MNREDRTLENDTRAIAVDILRVLAFLGFVILFVIIINPVFTDMGTIADNQTNDTYYEDESDDIITTINVISQELILIIAVLMSVMYLFVRAIRKSKFK